MIPHESPPVLRRGQWTTKGGIRVWVESEPALSLPEHIERIADRIIDAAVDLAFTRLANATARYCCAACGCLLLPAEDCAGCQVAAMNESEVA